MFKKIYRLPSHARIIAKYSARTPFFTLIAAPNNTLVSRFGFIISKRVEKRATGRNRTKRIFRSYVETLWERILPGYDFLFIIHDTIGSTKNVFSCEQLEKELQKGRFLK